MEKLIRVKNLQQFYLKAAATTCNGCRWLRSRGAKSPRVALASPQTSRSQSNPGFTMIEIVIVVLIVGILSAIAAPGWLAFVNRQRLNKANDAVLGAIQQAQREAKRTKLSYSVSFISAQNLVPQFVIYPANQTCSIPAVSDPRWTNLGQGQFLLYTNIVPCTATNTKPNQIDPSGASLAATAKTITFDYTGALPPLSVLPLKIVIAQAKPGTPGTPPPPTLDPNVVRRCVIVQTLIGGMQIIGGTQTPTDPQSPQSTANLCK